MMDQLANMSATDGEPFALERKDEEAPTPIHEKPMIIKGILATVNTDFALDLRESPIPNAGTGLFAATEIPEGATIFTAKPIVSCRHPTVEDACDYCFKQTSSGVHPSGRFKEPEDPHNEMKKCTGCRVARYCSPRCQSKDWKAFHKSECDMYKKYGPTSASALALLRIFRLDKDGKLGSYGLNVLQELKAHFKEHNDSERAEDIFQVVQLVVAVLPHLQNYLHVVWRMYTTLITNGWNMTSAETDLSVCWSFCLGVAMINHKCNPNAFLFMEGTTVVLRSLRKIADGEEICVSYVDESLGVLRRQEELEQKLIYNCECKKCRRERDELESFMPAQFNEEDRAVARGQLLKAQNKLETYLHKSVTEFNKTVNPAKNITACYVNTFQQMTRAAFANLNGDWPGTLAPLPAIRMALSRIHRNTGEFMPGLRYALRGALVPRRRNGSEWVRDLFEVTLVLTAISNMPDNEDYFGNDVFPTCRQIRFVVTGYVHRLAIDAMRTFGPDVAFARAIMATKALLPAEQGSLAEFKDLFADAQGKLLHWAGEIPHHMGVVLPAKLSLDNVVPKK